MATKAQKAATQSESPQQQTLPMQYDVRIHSLRLDGNCRAHASVNINGCFAIRGVKVMESSKGLFVSMPSYRAGNGRVQGHLLPCHQRGPARVRQCCSRCLSAGPDPEPAGRKNCPRPYGPAGAGA